MLKEEVIKKAVNNLMNPNGREHIIAQGIVVRNPRLEGLIQKGLQCEKVSFTPLNNGNWELNNVTSQKGYELYSDGGYDLNNVLLGGQKLNSGVKQPLPERINVRRYIKTLNTLRSVIPSVCVNVILVREPKKVKYRIAYMEIVDFPHAWVF